MKPRLPILTFVAVTCGLAASFMTKSLLEERKKVHSQEDKVGLPSKVADLHDRDKVGLDSVLSPGRRAVAVSIRAEKGFGGLVYPGCHVDVVHTYRRGENDADSKTILKNVLVMAVDQSLTKGDATAPTMLTTVTLELAPEDVNVLASAKEVGGSITVALRSKGDAE